MVPFPCLLHRQNFGAGRRFAAGAETGVSIPTQGGETGVATQKKRPPKIY